MRGWGDTGKGFPGNAATGRLCKNRDGWQNRVQQFAKNRRSINPRPQAVRINKPEKRWVRITFLMIPEKVGKGGLRTDQGKWGQSIGKN